MKSAYCFKEVLARFKATFLFFLGLALFTFIGMYIFDDGTLGDFTSQPLWVEKPLLIVLLGAFFSVMYSGQFIKEITTRE